MANIEDSPTYDEIYNPPPKGVEVNPRDVKRYSDI